MVETCWWVRAAASVAAIAVLGIQNYQLSGALDQTTIAANSQKSKTMIAQKGQLTKSEMAEATQVSATTLVAATSIPSNDSMEAKQEYAQADTQTRSLLKRYVDSHMQYASTAAFVPSVRVIAYTDNQ